jgi:hypothetical protein
VVYQVLALGGGARRLVPGHNTMHNMQVRGIQSGFDFLTRPAGFDIGESLFPFDSLPVLEGLLGRPVNTLRVAILGIVLTTMLGTLLGVGRFSRNAWCAACATPTSSVPQRAGAAAAADVVLAADRDPAAMSRTRCVLGPSFSARAA